MMQPQTDPAPNAALTKLRDTGLVLDDPHQDIRGRTIVDRKNDELGHVSGLFIDVAERKVRMIEVRAGGFFGIGESHFLFPVDTVTHITDNVVHINQTRDRVSGSPAYDPALIDEPTFATWEPFYGYYGISPYWGTGYLYPTFPTSRERDENDLTEPE